MTKPFRFAIVGTGEIAAFYMDCYTKRADTEGVEFAGAWNRTPERGQAFIAKYGGTWYPSLEKLLADPAVDAAVNLTLPLAHAGLTERCLAAGKHVHTEKPLALTVEEGRRLVDLADRKGVKLACAPFIHIGAAQLKVKELVREGRIGRPLAAMAEMMHGRVESWNPNPEPFYGEGAGPLLDVGPYPITLFVDWFGPVTEVRGMFDIGIPHRLTLKNRPFTVTEFDHGVALLKFAGGTIGRIALSFCNNHTGYHGIEVHGTDASLALSQVMDAGGELRLAARGEDQWRHVMGDPAAKWASGVDWSLGIIELARAVREGRRPAHDGRLALHVLDVALCAREAGRTGATVRPTTTV